MNDLIIKQKHISKIKVNVQGVKKTVMILGYYPEE